MNKLVSIFYFIFFKKKRKKKQTNKKNDPRVKSAPSYVAVYDKKPAWTQRVAMRNERTFNKSSHPHLKKKNLRERERERERERGRDVQHPQSTPSPPPHPTPHPADRTGGMIPKERQRKEGHKIWTKPLSFATEKEDFRGTELIHIGLTYLVMQVHD